MGKFTDWLEVKGHLGKGGVQAWSAGDIYPYRIKIIGHGPGEIQGVSPEGEVVSSRSFETMGDDFKSMHREVEAEVMEIMGQ